MPELEKVAAVGGGEEGGRRDPSARGRTVVGSRVRTSRNGGGWLEEEEQCPEKKIRCDRVG